MEAFNLSNRIRGGGVVCCSLIWSVGLGRSLIYFLNRRCNPYSKVPLHLHLSFSGFLVYVGTYIFKLWQLMRRLTMLKLKGVLSETLDTCQAVVTKAPSRLSYKKLFVNPTQGIDYFFLEFYMIFVQLYSVTQYSKRHLPLIFLQSYVYILIAFEITSKLSEICIISDIIQRCKFSASWSDCPFFDFAKKICHVWLFVILYIIVLLNTVTGF